jgi:tetratricopeptide (TPR) repeat protein
MASPADPYAEAVAHFTAGRSEQAEESCRAIIAVQPSNADAHNLLGLTLRRRGAHEDALAAFSRAAEINPALAPVHLNRGLTLTQLGHADDAERAFRQALACEPTSAPGQFHLGVLLHHRSQFEDAIACFQKVLIADPRHANTHALMGLDLLLLGRLGEAKASLEAAAALNPKIATVHDGLGILAEDEGRFADAIQHFEFALTLDPNFAPSHFNRAVAQLRRGDLAQGLPELEWRWRLPRDARASSMRDFPQPLWTGESLTEATLLIWGEQGLGDEIRAAGVVDDMLCRGDKIMLECDPRLVALLQRSWPSATIIARQDPPAPETSAANISWQCPGDTLLRHVRPTLEHFSRRSSFLKADAVRTAGFRARLKKEAGGRKIIGLSWRSQNAQFMRGKTLPLNTWAQVLRLTDYYFIDLQYGDTQDERETLHNETGLGITHLPDLDLTQDIDGLAALISECNLVITVSNTTAHLAGALGVPTWVMLPFGHFQPWYWFSDCADSPWYPSVKLYRQSKFGDWPRVIAQIAGDLGV